MKFVVAAVICAVAVLGSSEAHAMRAEIIDSIDLPERSADGTKINELSGLGWDAGQSLLYAVSDAGYLHHFRISVKDRKLAAEPVFATPISDSNVGLLTWSLSNAEGLHVRKDTSGKTELLIAFEDGPAIARFTPDGKYIADVSLPAPLKDADAYINSNKRLESVSGVPGIGIITSPEAHLVDEPDTEHSIFAMDGRRWHFPALQPKQSSIKALDPLPGGKVLVLERTRDANGDHANLRITDLAVCKAGDLCQTEEIAISNPGAMAFDFEGMTEIGDNNFLLVTDQPKGGHMLLLKLIP